MEIKISIDKKPFGSYKATSLRALQQDKVVIVEFPNCHFKWSAISSWIVFDLIRSSVAICFCVSLNVRKCINSYYITKLEF